MKLNLLTIFNESQILVQAKLKLVELLQTKKEETKKHVLDIIENKVYGYEILVTEYILSNITLPFYLKPFKNKIKKTIIKNLDKLFVFAKEKFQEI